MLWFSSSPILSAQLPAVALTLHHTKPLPTASLQSQDGQWWPERPCQIFYIRENFFFIMSHSERKMLSSVNVMITYSKLILNIAHSTEFYNRKKRLLDF